MFANLGRALAAAGTSFADVVELNYYLTDITLLPAVRAVRDEYVDTARPPASTAVQVSGAGHARPHDRDRGLGHLRRLMPCPAALAKRAIRTGLPSGIRESTRRAAIANQVTP